MRRSGKRALPELGASFCAVACPCLGVFECLRVSGSVGVCREDLHVRVALPSALSVVLIADLSGFTLCSHSLGSLSSSVLCGTEKA